MDFWIANFVAYCLSLLKFVHANRSGCHTTMALSLNLLVFSGLVTLIIAWTLSRTRAPRDTKPKVNKDGIAFGEPPHLPQPDGKIGLLWLLKSLELFRDGLYLQNLEQLFATKGKTFTYHILGTPVIDTCEPENAKSVFSTSQHDYDTGPRRRMALASIMGKGVFALDGKEWQHARATLRPAFARKNIQDFAMMEAHFRKLLAAIVARDYDVDLQALFFQLTMDTATDMLTGESVESLSAHENESTAFMKHWDAANSHIMFLVFTGPLGRLVPAPAVWRAKRYLYQYLDRLIGTRLASQDAKPLKDSQTASRSRYVFLDSLAQHTNDATFIRDQTLAALAGGRDTTASLLSNVMFILARRDDVWQRLRQEALSLASLPDVGEAISKAVYTRQCIDECESDESFTI